LVGQDKSRGAEKSGGKGGISQQQTQTFDTNPAGKRRLQPTTVRRRQPQNPHDPTSKDPFMRAGLSMGTNKTKIFKRAGMSMGG